ncbi:hypothetical protein CKO11_03200 [Rhodobacter sp. TJ_12]|uniref:TonB family protein n=1 Tax=Rhodobacter sp. TJ_12 TaxID=2029399 RepID=UPI001CBF1917|nr:TonB family protein [Rhodobacter sp. TJ_12]MBZ4021470.1 hypothetical protein [Rhodobacter sp. TJ_12]
MSLAFGRGAAPGGLRALAAGLGLSLAVHGAVLAGLGRAPVAPAALVAAGAQGKEMQSLAAAQMVDLMPEIALPAPKMRLPKTPPEIAADVPPPAAQAPVPPKVQPAQKAPARPVAKPAQKPAPPAQVRHAQSRAKGTGGGRHAGKAGQAAQAALSPGQEQSLQRQWGARLRAQVERRKSYPAAAGRAAGTVVVQLRVRRDGQLLSASVARSAGHSALDAAALRAVQRAGRFPPAPKGLTKAAYGFALQITFDR